MGKRTIWGIQSLTLIFSWNNKMQLLEKLKKNLQYGRRTTLNFPKFKVALNLTLQKSYHAYNYLIIKWGSPSSFVSYST